MTKTGLTPFETFSLMNSDILLHIQDSLFNAESAIINVISIFITLLHKVSVHRISCDLTKINTTKQGRHSARGFLCALYYRRLEYKYQPEQMSPTYRVRLAMALAMVKNRYMGISPLPPFFTYEHTSWHVEQKLDFQYANFNTHDSIIIFLIYFRFSILGHDIYFKNNSI